MLSASLRRCTKKHSVPRHVEIPPGLAKLGYHSAAVLPWTVAWGDMDVLGHVNNCVYFKYAESARIHYFDACSIQATPSGVGPILASIGLKFRFPLEFPRDKDVILACKVTSMDVEAGRFVLSHGVWSTHHDAMAAVGDGVIVSYCYDSLKKAPMPQEWVEKIEAIESKKFKH